MSKTTSIAVIVAAGTGRRMGGTVKKQYLEIQEKPVLFYTLKAFEKSNVDGIVIVTGSDEIEYVQNEIINKYGIEKVLGVCAGGKERYDSVYKGLKKACLSDLKGPDYVLVHDGVRPFIRPELINDVIENVKSSKACVVAVPVKDTIKEVVDGVITKTHDRSLLYQIQTPQAFDYEKLVSAYEKMYEDINEGNSIGIAVTDDAMLVEHYLNQKVHIVKGDYKNIKITTPEDLDIAEVFVKQL